MINVFIHFYYILYLLIATLVVIIIVTEGDRKLCCFGGKHCVWFPSLPIA